MGLILNIDTTTDVCSVALSKDGELLNEREDREGKSHASLLSYFIQQMLNEEQLTIRSLDAVSISKGPGSYTGLRIGVSTAKGICYGAGLPLIALHTLQSLTKGLFIRMHERNEQPDTHAVFVPMLDARRMEVYSAVLDGCACFLREVKAEVVDAHSFSGWLNKHQVYFFGNGSEKCRGLINHPNARFIEGMDLSARFMCDFSEEKYQNKQFEDLAYFEPFYLKDFIATKPRKNIIG